MVIQFSLNTFYALKQKAQLLTDFILYLVLNMYHD